MESVYGGEGRVSEDGDGAVAAGEEEVLRWSGVGEGEFVGLEELREGVLDGGGGVSGYGDENVGLANAFELEVSHPFHIAGASKTWEEQ